MVSSLVNSGSTKRGASPKGESRRGGAAALARGRRRPPSRHLIRPLRGFGSLPPPLPLPRGGTSSGDRAPSPALKARLTARVTAYGRGPPRPPRPTRLWPPPARPEGSSALRARKGAVTRISSAWTMRCMVTPLMVDPRTATPHRGASHRLSCLYPKTRPTSPPAAFRRRGPREPVAGSSRRSRLALETVGGRNKHAAGDLTGSEGLRRGGVEAAQGMRSCASRGLRAAQQENA